MTVATPEVLERISAPTGSWKVDRDRSAVEFSVQTFWGLSTVAGRFDRFDGYYLERPDASAIELTIDASSLDTGNRTRDRHLGRRTSSTSRHIRKCASPRRS